MKKFSSALLLAILSALVIVSMVSASFTNGNFEAGDFSGWTSPLNSPVTPETIFVNTGLIGAQPYGWASIARGAGGANLSAVVTSGLDPNTNNALNMVHNGTYAARVNSQDSWSGGGYSANANAIRQTFPVDSGDVQPDGSIHLAFAYAPVMVDPGHAPDQQPYFFVGVKNLTTSQTLYEVFSLVNQAGYPWTAGASFDGFDNWYYMPWQEVDLVSTAANPKMSVGDSIEIEVIASGCSPTGHPGYVYVDDFAFQIPSGCSPTLSTINPTSGPVAGGTQVTITGTNLDTVTALYFGTTSVLPAQFVSQSATQIVVNSPAGSAGSVTITVVNPCGSASFFNGFQYIDNAAPVANDDVYAAARNVTLNGTTVLVNDTDGDSDPLTAVLDGGPAHASAFTLNSNGTFTYTPDLNYTGQDTFTYFANDGTVNSAAPATVTINIAANDPPVIDQGAESNLVMSEDAYPVPFGPLTLTGTDLNGDTLAWSILTPPVYGAASIDPVTGVVSYVPEQNYNTDSHANTPDDFFVAQADDGNGGTATHTVNLTITPVADPFILNQAFRVTYNGWQHFGDTQSFGRGYRTGITGFFRAKPVMAFTTFTLISYTGPDQGKAQVFIDGVNKGTIDLYSAVPQYQVEFAFPGLVNGQHLVSIQPTGTKNAASTGIEVRVDALKFNAITYDDNMVDNNKLDMWYGSWLGQVDTNAEHNGYRVSNVKDSNMVYSWTGVEITWLTALGPSYGKAEIYVDGVLYQTVDLYAATQTWQHPITISGLTYGRHTLRIRVLGTKRPASTGTSVVMDGLDYE